MVEKVEELGPKLRMHIFCELGVLNDRKICVIEAGPFDYITAEVAEVVDSCKPRGIEPTLHAADNTDRAVHIRTECVGHAVHLNVAGYYVHRIPALYLEDRGKLPAFLILVAAKW